MTLPSPALVDGKPADRVGVELRPAALVGVVAGCLLLWVRPWLITVAAPVATTVAACVVLGLIGALAAIPSPPRSSAAHAWLVAFVGISAVVSVPGMFGTVPHASLALQFVVLDVVAAIVEELFFRRFVFGVLRPFGVLPAAFGSAALFAIVHGPTYGYWVVPLDLAAGLLFAWQRETTGRWTVPAATHVIANLMVLL